MMLLGGEVFPDADAPAIISQSFSGDSVSVKLKSRANTQIVVVVSRLLQC